MKTCDRNLRAELAALSLVLLCAGCIGIKPVSRPELDQEIRASENFWMTGAGQSGVMLRLHACLDRDENLRIFDADFISLDIVPVLLSLKNTRDGAVAWEMVQFSLRGGNWEMPALPFSEVEGPLFKKYGISAYNQAGLEKFRAGFRQLMLGDQTIGPREESWGVVFFRKGQFDGVFTEKSVLIVRDALLDGRKTSLVFELDQASSSSFSSGGGGNSRLRNE